MSLLEVRDLHVQVDGKAILKGLNLSVHPGEVHAIMGPNGSGKSTLANVLAGRPGYAVSSGALSFAGQPLQDAAPEARAQAGLFLAFQYPVEIPGVSNMELLKAAADSHRKALGQESEPTIAFMKRVRTLSNSLALKPEFLKRGVNEGFSGGEKKRNEILQMLLLAPKLAVLDETDSGLDIDALRIVAAGVNRFRNASNGVLLITHYQRLLNHIVADRVHVLSDGRIVESGDAALALKLEERGYAWLSE